MIKRRIVDWNMIEDKPDMYPPMPHQHQATDVIGLGMQLEYGTKVAGVQMIDLTGISCNEDPFLLIIEGNLESPTGSLFGLAPNGIIYTGAFVDMYSSYIWDGTTLITENNTIVQDRLVLEGIGSPIMIYSIIFTAKKFARSLAQGFTTTGKPYMVTHLCWWNDDTAWDSLGIILPGGIFSGRVQLYRFAR